MSYTTSGMTGVIHRLGYVYKKAKREPGKADPAAQKAFLETFENNKKKRADGDPIYFMDAPHPQHNAVIGCGWTDRRTEHPIKSNSGGGGSTSTARSTLRP